MAESKCHICSHVGQVWEDRKEKHDYDWFTFRMVSLGLLSAFRKGETEQEGYFVVCDECWKKVEAMRRYLDAL